MSDCPADQGASGDGPTLNEVSLEELQARITTFKGRDGQRRAVLLWADYQQLIRWLQIVPRSEPNYPEIEQE